MMDEVVKRLIRFVSRGFYKKQFVLIMDSIIIHSVLSDDDLVHLIGIQRKELKHYLAKLIEDRLLSQYLRKEDGPQNRPITKVYYFIHYIEAIDSIKWKIYSIVKTLTDALQNESNPQGFLCPLCKSRYSQLDAVTNPSPDMTHFLCSVCNSVLIEDDTSTKTKEKEEQLDRLRKRIEPIIEMLREIDNKVIEDNTFDSTVAIALQANSESTTAYINSTKNNISSSSTDLNQQTKLNVNITSNEESQSMELLQRQEKERLAKQNSLPEWHIQSTVGKTLLPTSGNSSRSGIISNNSIDNGSKEMKVGVDTRSNEEAERDEMENKALTEYYAELARRKAEEDAAEAKEEEEEDDEDDEDEDEEFEDVDVNATTNNETLKAPDVIKSTGDDDEDDEDDDFEFEDV